jgi:hypothetical protein
MTATQNDGQPSVLDAQMLSGFRAKVIRGEQPRVIDFARISPIIDRSVLDSWQRDMAETTSAHTLFSMILMLT